MAITNDGDGLSKVDAYVKDVTPGTGATDLGKAEDAAHTSGDTGVLLLGVRNDNNAVLSGTDGDYTPLALHSEGHLKVSLFSSATLVGFVAPATAGDAGTGTSSQAVGELLFNGSTFDRKRGNLDATYLASAARTATPSKTDATNYNARGIHIVIDVTAIAATPSVVFTLQGKDAVSGKYYTILASAAITGTGTTVLKVFPGATAAANTVANDILPRTFAIDAVHGDADSITYSVGYSLIV